MTLTINSDGFEGYAKRALGGRASWIDAKQ